MESLKNNLFKKEHVEEIYNERLSICKKCPHYDPEGKSDKAIFNGKESCGACGCPLASKLRSLATECGAVELGEEPRWTAVVDEDTAKKIKDQIKD